MGMFDHVTYSAPCFNCGEILTEWQSKDGPCTLATLHPSQVEHMYANCGRCNAWNEYRVILDNPPPTEQPFHVEANHREGRDRWGKKIGIT